MNYKNTSL